MSDEHRVSVTQLHQVKISRFRWWSNWIDIGVFNNAQGSFLLQMQISRRNAKKFKTRNLTADLTHRLNGQFDLIRTLSDPHS